MTRADLIASLVPSVITARWDQTLDVKDICDEAADIADEMIRRGIVKVDDAEPRTGNA